MQALVKRRYVLYYPPEMAGGERVQLVEGLDWFTEDKGFRRMEIDEIEVLDPMSSVSISYLKVWRVK